jgi:hypothetical protein
MKTIFILIFLLCVGVKAFPQLPENDGTWQMNWDDEFNYTGKPDPAKWHMSFPWGPGWDENFRVIVRDDGANTVVGNGFLSLIGKKDNYKTMIDIVDPTTGKSSKVEKIFPFTTGVVNTVQSLGYGMYDMKIWMPDDYHHDLYGSYFDNGFWQFDANAALNLDWIEFDYEITSGSTADPIFQGDNLFTFNAHVETPYGYMADMYKHNVNLSAWDDQAHFMLYKTDNNNYKEQFYDVFKGKTVWRQGPYFNRKYQSKLLLFGDRDHPTWHRLTFEWLPDQVKYYLDGKLWFRLEGDYVYTYTDYKGIVKSIQPVNLLKNHPMQAILNLWFTGNLANYNSLNYDPIVMKIDYFRYYQLKKACGQNVIQTGNPPYDLCVDNYIEQVYENVNFGSNGCTSCNVTVNGGPGCTRKSVHAKTIKFEDGFKITGESDFYACDVNCDAL